MITVFDVNVVVAPYAFATNHDNEIVIRENKFILFGLGMDMDSDLYGYLFQSMDFYILQHHMCQIIIDNQREDIF